MHKRTSSRGHHHTLPRSPLGGDEQLASSYERTARWVEEQSRVNYYSESSTPSRSSASTSTSNTLPSNRTTSSSDQSMQPSRQRTLPPHPSLADPIPFPSSTSVPHARILSRTESRSRTARFDRPKNPFPQGPPGSGYPILLRRDPPRSENGESQSQVSRRFSCFDRNKTKVN